jgi:hypothetical protein
LGILVGVLALGLNVAFCAFMLRVEKQLATKGEIPPKGQILYLKYYNFFRWGDRWFLSIMDFAIVFVLVERWPLFLWIMGLCSLAGVVWTGLWHWIYLKPSHNPDSCYPYAGVVSSLGRIHLVYFGAQYILGFMGIGMVVLMAGGQRPWSPVAFVGLGAGLGYFVMLLSDFVAGRAP